MGRLVRCARILLLVAGIGVFALATTGCGGGGGGGVINSGIQVHNSLTYWGGALNGYNIISVNTGSGWIPANIPAGTSGFISLPAGFYTVTVVYDDFGNTNETVQVPNDLVAVNFASTSFVTFYYL